MLNLTNYLAQNQSKIALLSEESYNVNIPNLSHHKNASVSILNLFTLEKCPALGHDRSVEDAERKPRIGCLNAIFA